MGVFAVPALYAVLVWWFTTGAILYLDGLPVRTFRWSMGAATMVLGGAVYMLRLSCSDPSVEGAYTAFSCAILIWGWLEMSFLMGFITGPRKTGCPDCAASVARCPGWRRFMHATQAIIYNELATLLAAGGILAATWGTVNRLALWTFLVLWAMRLSAKLNLFLGVPNVGDKFLPEHLQYLKGFFRTRAMNFLFPVSITGATIVMVVLAQKYRTAGAGDNFQGVSLALLLSLLGLALLEHWFMVLPLPSEKLWGWAMRAKGSARRSPSSGPPHFSRCTDAHLTARLAKGAINYAED
jgi:putative photosynthetic complex assembly protein 2